MSTQVSFHHHEDDSPLNVRITDFADNPDCEAFRSLSISFHENGVKQEAVFFTRTSLEDLRQQFPLAEVERV